MVNINRCQNPKDDYRKTRKASIWKVLDTFVYLTQSDALNYKNYYNQKMLAFCNSEVDYIASTRIDSNEIINEIFIDLVQQEINKNKIFQINLLFFQEG